MNVSNRDIAAVAGGLAVGIIGSRLLAPLLAAGRGAIGARLGEDPFEKLIQDHRDFIATLEEMEHAKPGMSGSRSKLFLKLKRSLAKHALAEEDIVYPLLNNNASATQETRQLYDEHADIKILLYEMESLLKQDADWTNQVRSLRTLIENHARDEEMVEFPKLRQAMDERRLNALSGQIRREEAMIL